MKRRLTDHEYSALIELSKRLGSDQQKQLLDDLKKCTVEEATKDGSRLLFSIDGYDRPPYKGQHAYPVEGTVTDSDGAELSVSLYADENNRVLELELLKWGDALIQKPNWDTFKVSY